MARGLEIPNQIPLSKEEFGLFQAFIYEHAGIRLPESKMVLVQNRLRKRLHALSIGSYREYHAYVGIPGHEAEVQLCLEALTTNETYFFRHKQQWDFFTQVFLPERLARPTAGRSLRVWSAAASTGEEAYSAAMALDDALATESGWTWTVEATDINEDVLRRAREGRYRPYAVQKLTERCLTAYFEHDPARGEYRVIPRLRQALRFERHNLMRARGGRPYDLVFLRNVLIYFDAASKATVLRHVAETIRPGGYLLLGGAESLQGARDAFDYVAPTIFRKRPERGR